MVDRGPEHHSYIADGKFGPILGHGILGHVVSEVECVLASVQASLEEHQSILTRLPALAVRGGLRSDNAQRLLDIAADAKLSFTEAWERINRSDD